jgi:tetratricopeptide (TPR) repeat protein
MRQIKSALLVALVVVVTGCANTGGYSNVPVEEASSRQGSVFDQSDYPTQGVPAQSGQGQSYPEEDYPSQEATSQERAPVYSVPSSSPGNNSAVIALLGAAEKQRLSGDYMRAAATLERAIRISPRDPELYYQLAQVRYLQRNYHQTEQLCRKAISLASGDKKLLERCRLLLEQVR